MRAPQHQGQEPPFTDHTGAPQHQGKEHPTHGHEGPPRTRSPKGMSRSHRDRPGKGRYWVTYMAAHPAGSGPSIAEDIGTAACGGTHVLACYLNLHRLARLNLHRLRD